MHTAAQNLKPAKNTRPHHGVAGPAQFNQFNTINWYQQTWHTIEFSNNRHTRHHHNQQQSRIAPEQLFKLTRVPDALQIGVSGGSSPNTRPPQPPADA